MKVFNIIVNPFSRREFVTLGVKFIKFWTIDQLMHPDNIDKNQNNTVVSFILFKLNYNI